MSVTKRAVRIVGSVLSIACIAWIGWRFYSSGLLQKIGASGHGPILAERIGLAVAVYAVGVLGLGFAWWTLQCALGTKGSVRSTIAAYALTQLGKYLPGNVAQYVGRHLMLRRQGLSHTALVICALAEAALLLCAALEWGAPRLLRDIEQWISIAAMFVLPCAVLAFAHLLVRSGKYSSWIAQHVPPLKANWFAAAFVIYLCFFSLMAATLTIVATAMLEHVSFLSLGAAAAISWMAGYVVIGAPAGIGIREVIFISLLGQIASERDILVLAAGFRIATFGGDLIAFLVGLALGARFKPTQAQLNDTID